MPSRYLTVFIRLFKANLMREMEYRANFLSSFVMVNLWLGLNIVFFKSAYGMVDQIGSWTEDQALFFVATFKVVDNVFFLLFFRGLLRLQDAIRSGEYDQTLVKPMAPLFLTCFATFDIPRIVNIGASLALFVYTGKNITTDASPALFFLMMVCGVVVYASMFLALNTMALHFINTNNLIGIFFDVLEFGRLPSTITSGMLRNVFLFAFPVLFVAGVPCEYVFGDAGVRLVVWAVAVAAGAAGVSITFFKLSLRSYTSASS